MYFYTVRFNKNFVYTNLPFKLILCKGFCTMPQTLLISLKGSLDITKCSVLKKIFKIIEP